MIFDSWDHAGIRMIGGGTDEDGVRPESLGSAIRAGANAVHLTPRAQNPTGACWTPERLRASADALSRYPHVLAVEDDHFGDIARERSGSLPADPRGEDRVMYIRSFSKSIAPELRLGVALHGRRSRRYFRKQKATPTAGVQACSSVPSPESSRTMRSPLG